MKNVLLFMAAMSLTAVSAAPEVKSVLVRQLWPWSTDVEVSYELSDCGRGVNLTVEAYDGETRICDSKTVEAAIDGKIRALKVARGSFRIDMAKLGLVENALSSFNVRLEAREDDVLYRIYDLSDPSSSYKEVTRGGLLNGEYGAVETDFAKVGKAFGVSEELNGMKFNTTLEDVVIWTGVTNDVRYKTTHLVMRKIPAKGKKFQYGLPRRRLFFG